jgi:hypothetical protein
MWTVSQTAGQLSRRSRSLHAPPSGDGSERGKAARVSPITAYHIMLPRVRLYHMSNGITSRQIAHQHRMSSHRTTSCHLITVNHDAILHHTLSHNIMSCHTAPQGTTLCYAVSTQCHVNAIRCETSHDDDDETQTK